jgi:stress response protein YsnF/sporulation protein YlmC with PRC-barrel domain
MSYSLHDRTRINSLVEKLRHRLKNFAVINLQGQRIGEVKDLTLDANRQLNLVVSQPDLNQKFGFVLLVSKLIKKIEPVDKTVLVDVNSTEIANLPEYTAPITPAENKLLEIPIASEDTEDIDSTDMKNSDRLDEALPASELTDITITPLFEAANMQNEVQANMQQNSSEDTPVLEEEVIRLLGERLVVDRNKRKVGDVIVRKEIETRMVQVPVRHEKLIVEQVSPERKQLAEIDLGQESIPQGALAETVNVAANGIAATGDKSASLNGELTVSGTFHSPKIASLLLNAIALERQHGCQQVRVEIVVENAERQKLYQEWVDRISNR